MKQGRVAKSSLLRRATPETRDGILVRACRGFDEFEACVRVERSVWKSEDIDVVPVSMFAVASETGGHVLGAFEDGKAVGFTLAIAGWRDGRVFLRSHMTAVLDSHRDRGIARRLKLLQREVALAQGIGMIEWTFDPLITKNAYFNFMRLGAVARRYLPNAYGITTSPLHSGLPTDRLIAEWHLLSPRVRRVLAGKRATATFSKKAVRITIPAALEPQKKNDHAAAVRTQASIRREFTERFGEGLAATAIAPGKRGVDYILEPWSKT